MAESDRLENILPDNERSLRTLARTLKLTQSRFSLILVRCNYTSLREQILQRLHQECTIEFAELVLPSSTTKLYNSILQQVENQPPAALMILGLESVQALDDLLVAANKARDKFKRDFAFPIILWVTDTVLHKLGRLAPDFNSWASPPIQFTIAPDDMVNSLRQKAEQAFSGDADFTLDGYDLETVRQDLASQKQESDPELQASLAFMLGWLDYRNNRLDFAIAHYQQSLTYWQQNNNLHRQGILLLNIALAYYSKAEQQRTENQTYWEETKNYLQQSLEIFEQAQHPELVAKHISQLGEVLCRLKAWEELHKLAHKALKLHQNYDIPNQIAQDYGFLAEVALEQLRWNDAHELAQKALETLEKIPNFLPQEQGKYHFLLAKSLRKLGQLNKAVNTLETAKNESQPQYNPLLYIQILEELHSLYFEQKQYERAFQLKQKQREIESQYGFRAFIGAGRLQPRRQVINPDNSPNQQSKDIGGEVVAAFGRQQDIKSLLHRIGRTDCKLTVIYGQSGVGKSSIVQAGLLPILQLTPFDGLETLPILVQVYTAWEKECGRLVAEKLEEVRGVRLSEAVETSAAIIEQLQQNENRNLLTVLIFDQFEEFFFAYKDQASRRPFYDFLRDCLNISYVKVILSLRQDYLHYLLEWSRTTELAIIDDDILDKNILYYLGNFSPSVAKSVIQSFTENSQFYLAPDLIDALVEDLASELLEVRPIELQVVGAQLQTEKITTLEQYRKHWLKEKLVERYLEEVVKDCGFENERAAQLVLYLLTNENNTRPLKTRAELEKDLATEAQNLDLVLEILVGSGLVFRVLETPANRYQLVHDYLVPFIRQQRSAELLAKIKEAEEEKQRMQAELNRVLQKQLRDALRAGIGLAGLAVVATGFAIVSLLAFIDGVNSQLNTLSAVSDGRLAAYQDMEALIQAIKAGKQLNSWWKIGIKDNTKKQVVAALQSASYGIRERNTLEGHSAAVNTVSFSPDGKLIASGSNDKTIRLWKSDDGSVAMEEPLKHSNSVTTLSFSPDSKMIASVTKDGIVTFWKINGQKAEKFDPLPKRNPVISKTDNDDRKTISGSANITLKASNLQDKDSANTKNEKKKITSVSFSPDGKLIAYLYEGGIVKILDLQQQSTYDEFEDKKNQIISIRFSPDSKMIVSENISNNNNNNNYIGIKIYNFNGKLIKEIQNYNFDENIIGIRFSDNGKIINPIGIGSLRLLNNNHSLRENILFFSSDVRNFNGEILASSSNSNRIPLRSLKSLENNYGEEFESLNGHTQSITSLSFSPNVNMLASASKDNTIKLWNIQHRNFATSDDSLVKNVNFRPNDQIIASNSLNNRVQLWQPNGDLLATLPGNNSAVGFSKNGETLVSASQDSVVQLWQRNNGKIQATLRGEVIDGSFSPDGKTIALLSNDEYSVRLFGNNGKPISTLTGHKGRVYKISFSRDGQTLATASEDKTIKIWNRNRYLPQKLPDYGTPIESMSLSSNGQNLVILDGDNTVKFWRRDGKLIKSLVGQSSSLIKIDFSPDGEMLAIHNLDDTTKVQLWKMNGTFLAMIQGKENKSINDIIFSSDNQTIGIQYDTYIRLWKRDGTLFLTIDTSNHIPGKQGEKIYNIVFSSDNQTIAIEYLSYIQVYRRNGTLVQTVDTSDRISRVDSQVLVTFSSSDGIKFWQKGKLIRTISDNNENNNNDKLFFDGKTLAIIKGENEVELQTIDVKLIKNLHLRNIRPQSYIKKVTKIDFIPNSDILAISGVNDTIKLWKIQNNAHLPRQLLDPLKVNFIKRHSKEITSVSISPDGKIIASASRDKTVKLWQYNGELIKTLKDHNEAVNSVSFSPDGKIIASASDDQTIKLWKVDGTSINFPAKHSSKVNRVIFSPDGKIIASASDDKTVKLWNTDGTEIRTLKESYPVTGISFSHDSKMIASATEKTIRLWNVEDGELLSTYQRFGTGDVSFGPGGKSIAAAGNNAVAVWDFNLDKLLEKGCKLAWYYLKNNPNAKSDSNLCPNTQTHK